VSTGLDCKLLSGVIVLPNLGGRSSLLFLLSLVRQSYLLYLFSHSYSSSSATGECLLRVVLVANATKDVE